MSYSTCFFDIAVDVDYVELFHDLSRLVSAQGLKIETVCEYSPSTQDPLRRRIELSRLDEELKTLAGTEHAPIHAWCFPVSESNSRGIPVSVLSVYFRLLWVSGSKRKCVVSGPGEMYVSPEWSVPNILVDTDISLIVDGLSAKWPTRIVRQKEPRLGPRDCVNISQSVIHKELGVLPPIDSICRFPGNSFPVLRISDYWSVWFEKVEDQVEPFVISIEDDSGRAELL